MTWSSHRSLLASIRVCKCVTGKIDAQIQTLQEENNTGLTLVRVGYTWSQSLKDKLDQHREQADKTFEQQRKKFFEKEQQMKSGWIFSLDTP